MSNEQKEQAKDGTHKRKAGDGKQKSGLGKKKKSKANEEEQKKKKRKGKRKFKITDYMKRRGLAKTNLKQNDHLNSTNSLVSSVANSIHSNSLEKSKGKQRLQDTSPVEGAGEQGRPLENAPECGIPRPGSNNQQPWLGALFVVPLDSPEKADKFIVPVAIISARTRLDPDRPTIIVASGEMFGDEAFNNLSSSVSSG